MSWNVTTIGRMQKLCTIGCQSKTCYSHLKSAFNIAALESLRYGQPRFVYQCGDHYHITGWYKPGAYNYIESRRSR